MSFTFLQFLKESYVDLFSDEEKSKYAELVFDLVQKSYAKKGGILGNGFRSPEDMVKNIKHIKLSRRNNKVVAGFLYKDKNGRKLVAGFTDGSREGKIEFAKMLKDEFTNNRGTYSEISAEILEYMKKYVSTDVSKYLLPAELAKEVLDDEIEITEENTYVRNIGGEPHEKILIGDVIYYKANKKFKPYFEK